MKKIYDLKIPTLAAINGAIMGGGMEIALYCKYRSVSDAVGIAALPECFLGLVPGWGGTQLLPKLIGPEKAIEIIITNPLNRNKMIKAKDMLELGIADKMFPNGEFYDMSFDLLVDIIDGKVKIDRKPVDWSKLDDLYNDDQGVHRRKRTRSGHRPVQGARTHQGRQGLGPQQGI